MQSEQVVGNGSSQASDISAPEPEKFEERPTKKGIVEYRGPSLKAHVKELSESWDSYSQIWRAGAREEPVDAPWVEEEDCIFWNAHWMKNGKYQAWWANGEFSGTRFRSNGKVLELNRHYKRFERLILGENSRTYARDRFPEDGKVNQTEFAEIGMEEIIDSPEGIDIILSNPEVKKHIKKFLRKQTIFYHFLDYVSFSAVHSQCMNSRHLDKKEKELLARYESRPTILYSWNIQGFDGWYSSNRVTAMLDARTGEVVHTEYKGRIKRSFGS